MCFDTVHLNWLNKSFCLLAKFPKEKLQIHIHEIAAMYSHTFAKDLCNLFFLKAIVQPTGWFSTNLVVTYRGGSRI